jgi:NDP-sugar pyrophosphorylase family protein
MLPVIILAGGLGTRMYPLTSQTPKSLIQILGIPFLEHQLNHLESQGASHVILCLSHLGEEIESHIKNKCSYNLKIDFSYDGETQIGTGGAIKKALPLVKDSFFVMYGDSYLPINFKKIEDNFLEFEKVGLMTVFFNSNKLDKSNVIFSDNKVVEYNKKAPKNDMKYIDYGISVLSKKAFDLHNYQNCFDLSDLYHDLSLSGDLYGYEVKERFYEVGSMQGLKDLENYFLNKNKV